MWQSCEGHRLAYLKRIEPGSYLFETPAGKVTAMLNGDGSVSLENVVSYRFEKDFGIEVPEIGPVKGDIAYGGNWFFLIEVEQLDAALIEEYTQHTRRIMRELRTQGIRGRDGDIIDHVQLIGPPSDPAKANDGRRHQTDGTRAGDQ